MNFKRAVVVFCILLLTFSMPIKVKAEEGKLQHVILIDPGHGGIDGGARSKNGTIEKDINLSISLKLKKALEEQGYTVYLTREDDKELDTKKVNDLNKRCEMKKDKKCDMFISIHQNMFPNAKCFGAQVWYSNNDKSKVLAENIQDMIKQNLHDNNKRISKPAKNQYRILRDGYDGACVLIECGFLSNYEEEQKLKNEEHQDKLVKGILSGVKAYVETLKN
ncbi:N-acetylmuramoyl-L-alanine amidase CwlD [Clostridium sp. CTA-5]